MNIISFYIINSFYVSCILYETENTLYETEKTGKGDGLTLVGFMAVSNHAKEDGNDHVSLVFLSPQNLSSIL